MNPGHVKGIHDVNEVAIFCLMDFAFREGHFLSKYPPPKKSNGLLVPMYSSFVHIIILSLIILCNIVSSLSSSRGSLINVNVFSVTFGFDPRPMPNRIKSTLSSNLLHHFKQVHYKRKSSFCVYFIIFYASLGVFLNLGRIRQLHVFQRDPLPP